MQRSGSYTSPIIALTQVPNSTGRFGDQVRAYQSKETPIWMSCFQRTLLLHPLLYDTPISLSLRPRCRLDVPNLLTPKRTGPSEIDFSTLKRKRVVAAPSFRHMGVYLVGDPLVDIRFGQG